MRDKKSGGKKPMSTPVRLVLTDERYNELMALLHSTPSDITNTQLSQLMFTTGVRYPGASPLTSPMFEELRALVCSRGLA